VWCVQGMQCQGFRRCVDVDMEKVKGKRGNSEDVRGKWYYLTTPEHMKKICLTPCSAYISLCMYLGIHLETRAHEAGKTHGDTHSRGHREGHGTSCICICILFRVA